MIFNTYERLAVGIVAAVAIFVVSTPFIILWKAIEKKDHYHSLSCVDVSSGKEVFSATGQVIFDRSYTGIWEVHSEHGRDKSYSPPPNTVCSVRKHKRHDLDAPGSADEGAPQHG